MSEEIPLVLKVLGQTALLGCCLLVTIGHFVMEPLRWNRCYQPVGSKIGSRRCVRDALFSTALATYVLPFKLGIPLRIFLLRRHCGLTLHFVGVVVTLDGLASLFTWATVTALCAWIAALRWNPPWYLWIVILLGVIVCVVALAAQGTLRVRMLRGLREALALMNRPWQRIVRSTTILVVDVLSYGLRHALLLLLVTGNAGGMLIGGAAGIMATFAGIISGLPMGLVGYDATLVALLALAGVRPEHALLIALINRVLNFASAALLGVPAAMRLGLGDTFGSIIKRLREIAHGRV